MKKVVSMLLAMVLVLSIAACGDSDDEATGTDGGRSTDASDTSAESAESGGDSSSPASDGGGSEYEPDNKTLTVGIPADPRYWDPWGDFNNGRRNVIPIVYQTLASYAPDLENGTTVEYLVMASGYEMVEDDVYEITLREGIYDTAGHPFTASDVVFCLDSAREMGIWWELNAVDDIEVIDDLTLRMYTNDNLNVGDFQNILTNFPMVTQASFEESEDGMITTPVGTSGYVLTEYVAGASIVFEKTDTYWNDAANVSRSEEDGYCPWYDCTKLDTINFEVITDTSATSIALESGDINLASTISIADTSIFLSGSNEGNFSYGTRPDNMYGLSFNTDESSPTNNYNLRMALAHCVDAQGVLDAAYDGHGIVLKAWAFPTYTDWQDAWYTDDYFEYDLDLAREYLEAYYEETGTTSGDLKLRLLNQSGSTTGKIGEAVQAYIVALVGEAECVELLIYDRTVYESMWEDPGEFDLLLMYAQTASRTTSAYTWGRQANASTAMSGNDLWHSGDPETQALLHAAIGVDTTSDETIAAFQAHINERAYIKNLICGDIYIIGESWISGYENAVGYKDALAVLALDYDWSRSGQ